MRLVILMALCAAPGLAAQEPPVGQRVRVRTGDVVEVPGLARIHGRDFRVEGGAKPGRDTQTLTLTREGEQLTLPRARATLVGEVVATDEQTLTLRLPKRDLQVTVPRASIARLELSRGRRPRSALRGAGIGLLAGALGGVVLGLASGDDTCPASARYGCLILFRAQDKAVMGGVGFGLLGTVVGAIAGASSGERWEKVEEQPRKPKLALRPLGVSGLALKLSF